MYEANMLKMRTYENLEYMTQSTRLKVASIPVVTYSKFMKGGIFEVGWWIYTEISVNTSDLLFNFTLTFLLLTKKLYFYF